MKSIMQYISALWAHIPVLSILAASVVACNPNYDMLGMFNGTSPEVAVRFAESMAYNDSVGVRHVVVPSADYRVYVCTDSHIDSLDNNLTTFVQAAQADTACRVVLHLGDLINARHHIPHAVSLLQPLMQADSRQAFFITLGNHDIYFNQWHTFASYFGSSVYWFDTHLPDGTPLDRFICLDSAEGTLGTEQMAWLKDVLAVPVIAENGNTVSYRHTIVFTHTHLFKQDASQGHTSNYAMEETFELLSILSQGSVSMYWCGHDHSREITHYAGLVSIIVDALEEHYPPAFYMVADFSDKITYQFIEI